MNITEILAQTTSPDANIRQNAEKWLEQTAKKDLTQFLRALMLELSDEAKPPQCRQAAGLYIKNIFLTKEEARQRFVSQQWLRQPPQLRANIRQQLLTVLSSPTKAVSQTAAQTLAVLFHIEIAPNQPAQQLWLSTIDTLVEGIKQAQSLPHALEGAIRALGFIFETPSDILKPMISKILSVIVFCLKKDKTPSLRIESCKALYNMADYLDEAFQDQKVRDMVMQFICEATQENNHDLRLIALETIVKISFLYYTYLPPYFAAFLKIVEMALKSPEDEEDIALQGIEILSTIAELECEIMEELEEAKQMKVNPEEYCTKYSVCHNLIRSSLEPIVHALCSKLEKENEDVTDEDWNISNASGTCLALISRLDGDNLVKTCLPFISANIVSPDWRKKEAAMFCFGAIMEGPTNKDNMNQLLRQVLLKVLEHVADKEMIVRDTTLFTLGRIAKYHPGSLLASLPAPVQHGPKTYLEAFLAAVVAATKDVAQVASKACWVIHNLAEAFEDNDPEATSTALSPYFQELCKVLIETTQRPDFNQKTHTSLKINTFEALCSLINSATIDTHLFLETKLMTIVLGKLQDTIQQSKQTLSGEEKEELIMIQGLLCGALLSLTTKLKANVEKYSDPMMQMYLTILSNTQNNTTVHEDILMAIGGLAEALQGKFDRYMPTFVPFLVNCLKNRNHIQLCTIAVNIVGNLCSALGKGVANYTDPIMEVLFNNLKDNDFDKNLKPQIISTFGDIAVAIRGNFDTYLNVAMNVLNQASNLQVPAPNTPQDSAVLEYVNLLRESVLEAYTGILQGLKTENKQALTPYVDQLVRFLKTLANDETIDEVVFKGAVNCIGDLVNVFGARMKPLITPDLEKMVEDAQKSGDKTTRSIGKWVEKQLKLMEKMVNSQR